MVSFREYQMTGKIGKRFDAIDEFNEWFVRTQGRIPSPDFKSLNALEKRQRQRYEDMREGYLAGSQ